ncbi:MAG: MFS transporter [Clostridia bacterium]|nr:MFS transporter [Clostridia bacterium]
MKKLNTSPAFSRSCWMILLLFGTVGQLAWSVENMYFNLFVFETVAPSLDTVTLMVQLSGIAATVTTLVAGVISDKIGNRRALISWGYTVWGVTVALFGCLSPELVGKIFSLDGARAVSLTLILVVVGDCVMTVFGSTANDAAFNAWVTDNTKPAFRGTVEGVLSILPLIAMLIVAGGFGILVSAIGYTALFIGLGAVISLCGIVGIFIVKDSPDMERSGTMRDIFYGFRPSVVRSHLPLYVSFLIILVYGIACQIFMPYLIIYMKTYLSFTVVEYSVVFGAAIILGAVINVFLGRLSDRMDKVKLLYVAAGIMAVGLFGMYLAPRGNKTASLIVFGIFGFVMICGYIFVSALCGSTVRDYTPEGAVGKLQGVRMVFSVLIPMLAGPAIGNAINRAQGLRLEDAGADIMTTEYIPAPEIFLVGAIATLLIFAVIPLLDRAVKAGKVELNG